MSSSGTDATSRSPKGDSCEEAAVIATDNQGGYRSAAIQGYEANIPVQADRPSRRVFEGAGRPGSAPADEFEAKLVQEAKNPADLLNALDVIALTFQVRRDEITAEIAAQS